MRFFHLADLHIGKKVNQVPMVEAQAEILAQVLAYADTHQPDVMILAGDLYDRRNPSLEAIQLLDDFLSEVVLVRGIQVLAVGGNHDSGERLDFANGLLARAGLFMEGALRLPVPMVRMHDAYGPVDFHLLPFADVPTLQHLLDDHETADYGDLMKTVLAAMVLDDAARHVLVHHGMVLGYEPPETCDSERDLFVGGTDYWRSDRLKDFSYVALGHLHRAQAVLSEHIRYSGSILKYSFSEETHQKQCLCVDLDAEGACTIQTLPLQGLRDLVTLTGTLEDLLRGEGNNGNHRDDYVRVVLTDTGELLEPMARLRRVYPNIMLLERPALMQTTESVQMRDLDTTDRSPEALFTLFYEQMTGEAPQNDHLSFMKQVLKEAREGLA